MVIRGSLIATRWAVLFIIAKVSTTKQFAVVTIAMTYVEIFRCVFDFGIDTHSIRNFSILNSVEKSRKYYSDVLHTKIISGFAACLILAGIFSINYDGDQSMVGIILSFQVITTLLMNLPISYYQSQLSIISIGPYILTFNLMSILSIYFFAGIMNNVQFALVSLVLFDLVLTVFLLRKLNKELGSRNSVNIHEIVTTIKSAIHLGISNSINVVYSRMDMILLSKLSDIISVGMYGFAYRLTEPFHYTAANYSISVYSDMCSKHYESDPAAIRLLRNKYIKKAAMLGTISAVSCYAISYVAIRFFFTNYSNALPICVILSGLLLFKAVNTTLTSIINSTGNYRIMVGISIINILSISTLLYLLITAYDTIGASLALLSGEALNTIIQLYVVIVVLNPKTNRPNGVLASSAASTNVI